MILLINTICLQHLVSNLESLFRNEGAFLLGVLICPLLNLFILPFTILSYSLQLKDILAPKLIGYLSRRGRRKTSTHQEFCRRNSEDNLVTYYLCRSCAGCHQDSRRK